MQSYRGGSIAMVFQDPMLSLDPAFSVGEQIAEVLKVHGGISAKAAKARAVELMDMVRIPDAQKRYSQRALSVFRRHAPEGGDSCSACR